MDETSYALAFDPAAGTWRLLDGPAADHTLPDTRAAITRYLREHRGGTPKEIADATGISYGNVAKTCQRMTADSQLCADPAGRYRLAGAETVHPVHRVHQPALTCGDSVDTSTTPLSTLSTAPTKDPE